MVANLHKNIFKLAVYLLLGYFAQKVDKEENFMQRRMRVIARFIMVTMAGVLLLGTVAEVAAGKPPLKVTLGLPSQVNAGDLFNITINVQNKSDAPAYINKVAVGYSLTSLIVRGPYEVTQFTPLTVPVNGSASFSVPFKIPVAGGTVVGLAVFLANSAYTEDGLMGAAIGGVRVN